MANRDLKLLKRYRLAKKLHSLLLGLAIFIMPLLGIFIFMADSNRALRSLVPVVIGFFMAFFIPLVIFVRYYAYHCPFCGMRFYPLSQNYLFPSVCNHCGKRLNK